MKKDDYDPNKDGVIAVAQTEADMKKAVYDPHEIYTVVGGEVKASDDLIGSTITEGTSTSETYEKKVELTLNLGAAFIGTAQLRIKFDIKRWSTGGTGYGRIYKNGVEIGTERANTTDAFITYSEDIAGWANGDKIQLYVKKAVDTYNMSYKNFRVYAHPSPITQDATLTATET